MKNPGNSAVVALFVRVPVPGRVKTRLVSDPGDDGAIALNEKSYHNRFFQDIEWSTDRVPDGMRYFGSRIRMMRASLSMPRFHQMLRAKEPAHTSHAPLPATQFPVIKDESNLLKSDVFLASHLLAK